MKKGSIFWGVFFLSLGLLILGRQFNIINYSFSFILDLWPLILILLGISLFKIPEQMKNSLYGISGLLLALFISTFFSNNERYWRNFHLHWDNDCRAVESAYSTESIPDGQYKTAVLEYTAAAGDFEISGISDDDLIELDGYGYLEINKQADGEAKTSYKANSISIFDGDDYERESRLKLNPGTIWGLDINIAASEFTADLSDYNINQFKLTASTSGIDLKFGDKSPDVDITIDTKACGVQIRIPESAGCELNVDNTLSGIDFRDFQNIGNDVYRTENFETSNVKFSLNIQSGVSGVEIIRY